MSESKSDDAPTRATGHRPDDPDTQPTEMAADTGASSSAARRVHSYSLRPGQRFGPYEIQREIGHGGMGEVYEALHGESGHRVALKLISGDPGWIESQRKRFLREGQLAAAVNHPHSLYVYGTEEIDGIPVIAMELAPGGTLKSRLEKEGPLPPNEAVRAILQIIEGLQAAASLGVLHRDIKPANCFLDRDGSIKIGDYGLAISMAGTEATQLTATGTILGTPAFASPEQLRADELDVRSDIYSVGATLYYLLTGRCLFEGATGLKLMSQILEKEPSFPKEFAASLPQELIRIVLRCLEKKPSDRYQDYAELTKQLEKFRIEPPLPVPLLRRFAAGFVDYLILMGLLLTYVFRTGGPDRTSGLTDVGLFAIIILYSGLTEGFWGATLGKAMAGIRARRPTGAAAGLARAFLRGLVFWSPSILFDLLRLALVTAGAFPREHGVVFALDAISDYAFLLVFLTARGRNGWAGIHELASHTLTVRTPPVAARPEVKFDTQLDSDLGQEMRVGPYLVPSSWSGSAPGEVLQGLDPTLRRRVWIRICTAETPPVSESRRTLSRSGRLRWLNGRRIPGDSWDSYEAVDGRPFLAVVRSPQSWELVRHWLVDLGEELLQEQNEAARVPLRLDQVWITVEGKALLLDFPLPVDPNTSTGAKQIEDADHLFEKGSLFLQRIARLALAGPGPDRAAGAAPSPGRPLPIHAGRILELLATGDRWGAEAWLPPLRDALRRRTHISRRRRISQMILSCFPAILAASVLVGGALIIEEATRSRLPNFRPFKKCLREIREIEGRGTTLDPRAAERIEALRIYMAGPLRDGFPSDSTAVLGWGAERRFLNEEERKRAVQILEDHPDPTSEEVDRAEQTLGPFLKELEKDRSIVRRRLRYLVVGAGFFVAVLITFVPLLLLFSFVFRGGIGYSVFEMALVDSAGRRVSRWRCLVRAIICWLPFLAIWLMVILFNVASAKSHPTGSTDLLDRISPTLDAGWDSGLLPVTLLLFLLGLCWAIARPQRSLPDVVARTHIVPE